MTSRRALIFANGCLPDLEAARRMITPGDALIAADGGTRHLLALGLLPGVLIGDLDSLTPQERHRVESGGSRIHAAAREKDETDLELALQYALSEGYPVIRILAALGGRMDQALANLALLSDPALAGVDLRLDDGVEEAFFTRCRAALQGAAGEVVSLLPWGADVTGVCTHGLKWTLHGEKLRAHRTRGISNQMLADAATVEIKTGLLLILHRRNPPGR